MKKTFSSHNQAYTKEAFLGAVHMVVSEEFIPKLARIKFRDELSKELPEQNRIDRKTIKKAVQTANKHLKDELQHGAPFYNDDRLLNEIEQRIKEQEPGALSQSAARFKGLSATKKDEEDYEAYKQIFTSESDVRPAFLSR